MIDNEWKLSQACDICIADMGKEDEFLSRRLYAYVRDHFGIVPGRDWDYDLIDKILLDMLNKTII